MNSICEIDVPSLAGTTIPIAERETTSQNVCVWLVDDNDRFRTALAELLGRMRGIQCARHFSSPDAMLSTLASHVGPDVILLDIQMRDRNGLDVIGPIKALSRDTQVLMLTSMYDSERHNRAIAEGASDFLLKSYTPEEIVERIRNPSRRVNARRRRAKALCAATQARSTAKFASGSPSLLKDGFNFLRTLIG
jgi:two-component system nitrate/nitrite response regulator NarL